MSAFQCGAFQSSSFQTGVCLDVVRTSGGWEDYGSVADRRRLRERKEASKEAEKVIEQVALRQAEGPSLDETQRIEELSRELLLQGIEWETRYLTALNLQREAFINAEIGRRIRQVQDNNNLMILLALASN